ncbi:MAG: putative glycoside hydrolase [Firmicutes bacterium]|nr:putative glycoside hydrolase [Bacillota bacterium]
MLSYRIRMFLRRAVPAVLLVLLAVLLALLVVFLWLGRYILYTRDGAVLDFSLSQEFADGVAAVEPEATDAVEIYYNQGDNLISTETSNDLTQLSGYYITADMLKSDFAAVYATVQQLSASTPVMLDVKSIKGEFYYTSSNGSSASSISASDVDELIAYLHQSGHYVIARMPALRDYYYGLNHVNDGVFVSNRLSLWMDSDACYWLNPNAEGTVTYLVSIITELRTLGVDEVVLYDFSVPVNDNIYFTDDRTESLNALAADLVRVCTTDTFALSFENTDSSFTLPDGRTRLYFSDVEAASADSYAYRLAEAEDRPVRVVFLTELMDTRFSAYGVLHPLDYENS